MRFVYVMDPLEKMHPDKDTTFAFLRAAQRRGHENLHCLLRDLSVDEGRPCATTRVATIESDEPCARYGRVQEVALDEVDAILIRKDPPFDADYHYATQLLDLARSSTFIMNDPRALRDANEKLYTLHFPEVTPRTYVTSNRTRIRAFVDAVGGTAVIKPLDQAGGIGVMMLGSNDLNTPSIIDLLTAEGTHPVIVQEFLPAVREGDKRILLLNGKALGAILRVPKKDDLRANIHVGGRVKACTLTPAEEEIIAHVGPRLRSAGLYFVGLDVIGEKVTEINVTSPTGIQELGRLNGTTPEDDVIEWLEQKVATFGKDG
jgi:glutathione synthase